MKEVSREQGFQLMAVLQCNADWSGVSSDVAQRIIDDPVGSGREFTRFLANSSRMIMVQSSVVPINRVAPFNPAKFLGQGWSIWQGPIDGDGLCGDEDQDTRSLEFTQLDLSQVKLVTCLHEDETRITGEERLRRLKKANFIRLDAQSSSPSGRTSTSSQNHGKRKPTAVPPTFSLTAPAFAVRAASAARCVSAGAAAGGAGTTSGLCAVGTPAILRSCSRVELCTFSLIALWPLTLCPSILNRRAFSFLKYATMQAVLGEYAGDYGCPLPNPATIIRECLRPRFETECFMEA